MSTYEYPGEELDVFSHAVNWKRYFASLLRRYVAGSVLEVGAGLGETTRALWNSSVERWVCLEPDPRLARRLSTLVAQSEVNPEVVIGDIRSVAAAERFNCIVYIDVLEHIAADAAELSNAAAHLAKGGHLVVLSPAFPILFSAFDRALGHERRYTKRTLARQFPPELERVALFYADSVGMALSLANRMLLKQTLPTVRQIRVWDRSVIPVSRFVDPLVGRSFGRSIIAVYRRPATGEPTR
jgi:SAM-dependent methyltransferase